MFSFEKTPHVCADCGSDEWHSNQTFHNRQKYWLPDEIEFWCHKCEAEVDVMEKEEYEEYEEEKENGERS